MKANYCLTCGSPLSPRIIGDATRQACTACDYVHWGDYSIGAGGLVVQEGRVLLVRRAQDPGRGFWTNPGGYAEQQEWLHETVVREVLEETGIVAKVSRVVALRDRPGDIHNLYVAYTMAYVSGHPVPDGVEVDAADFFSLDQMVTMNVAPLTRWLVDIAMRDASGGLNHDAEPQWMKAQDHGLFRV